MRLGPVRWTLIVAIALTIGNALFYLYTLHRVVNPFDALDALAVAPTPKTYAIAAEIVIVGLAAIAIVALTGRRRTR